MNKEILLLRELAKKKAEFAADQRNLERQKRWTDVNDLKSERPAIYINEIPWNEMNVDDNLSLTCEDPFHRALEKELKQEMYMSKHIPYDQVISNYIESPIVVKDSGFGIQEQSDIIRVDENTTAPARHFHIQISGVDDIEKIKDPVVSLDQDGTQLEYHRR